MSALFVTGIGTGVGKTHVVVSMLKNLMLTKPIVGLKPVISGYDQPYLETDSHLIQSALSHQGVNFELNEVSPFRYKAPLSVDMAAQIENKALPYAQLLSHTQNMVKDNTKHWVVEGIGGAMVPLTQDKTTLDWIDDLKLPVVLVASTYLGALSHTLCTVRAMQAREIEIAMIIINQAQACVGLAQTKQSLSRFIHGDVPLCLWPRAQSVPPKAVKSLFKI